VSGEDRADVVVVGAGNAALCAAIAARREGADVVVLERAPEAFRGGNTRFTGGIFRFSYPTLDALEGLLDADEDLSDVVVDPYSSELYTEDLERLSNGRSDPDLTRVLVDSSFETATWLHGLGVRWEFARTAVEARSSDGKLGLQLGAAVRTQGKGPQLSETLFRRAQELGVDVRYEVDARALDVDDDGALRGIAVSTPDGERLVQCGGAVLACGGFEASAERRRSHLGGEWERARVRGTPYNTGDMLLAALEAGAASAGDWSECHATPVDADAPEYGDLDLGAATNRLSYPYGVMVNLRGERFADEGEDFKLYTYARMGTAIMHQPHALAIQIFDARAVPLLEERYAHTEPLVADTLPGLVDLLVERYGERGLAHDALVRTLDEYNGATGTGTFDPISLDGVRTTGLIPDKTNWALPLAEPPFLAYAVTAGITFTFGGLRVGPDAAVLREDGTPITGLYAAGEITGGFFYENYPAGAGLMRGAVFGRLGGTGAARAALTAQRR
jgi:tricarballylate dehydrogenase